VREAAAAKADFIFRAIFSLPAMCNNPIVIF
jgi:hypothetical protein